MSFFGSIFHAIGTGIGQIAQVGGDLLSGNIGKAAGDVIHSVTSDIGLGSQQRAPRVQLPVALHPSNPASGSSPSFPGGTVSMPFVGPTKVPGYLGSAGQNLQTELSNLTGIPVYGAPAGQKNYGVSTMQAPVKQGSGIKAVTTYRAVQPGYVVVHFPDGSIQAVPKEVARHLVNPATGKRLWKPTPKPAVSAHDMKVAKEYKRVAKKLARFDKDLGFKQEKAGTRSRGGHVSKAQEAKIIEEVVTKIR